MDGLSHVKFTEGKFEGKTMADVLKEDSVNRFQYAFWVKNQMAKNLLKVTPSQLKYFTYATQEGVFE